MKRSFYLLMICVTQTLLAADFEASLWDGMWGSDGAIHVADLNGDGKDDVFMWRDSDKKWTANISNGNGFARQIWDGAWGSDGPTFVGDLNGDGKADVFMWRNSDHKWTVNLTTGQGFTQQVWDGAWGSDGPISIGDLNGDGKTDVFMWRDSDKKWTVNLSTGNSFTQQGWTGAWGSDGPIFVGDLNGDGRTDVFMWRNSDHKWSVNLSTGSGFSQQQWSGAWGSDGPISIGDLNGDGRIDVFMWRDSDKKWTANLSTGNGFVQQAWSGAWGSDGPISVGDLNGDGKTDVFMWRSSDKKWMVNLSTGNSFTQQAWVGAWGSDGPISVGDLDGNGKTDVFMWRDSDKKWSVNLSAPPSGFTRLPLSASPDAKRAAVVFDFDTDSCYPSPAISTEGGMNAGLSVTGADSSFVAGCRASAQLDNSNTYYRRASISKNGVEYSVRMYALYFMKDKDLPGAQAQGVGGHRHDWEYALVWTTDGRLTHASRSHHGDVDTKPRSELHFDAAATNTPKIVYHKFGGSTHEMRFADDNEQAENDLKRWVTPTIVDWYSMAGIGVISNDVLRARLNAQSFGEADCSVCDKNFPNEISKSPPNGYPSGADWKAAALTSPP